MEAVYKLLREVKVLPPSPQVLPKVLDALRHEQTTLEEVGELIALDPVLTAKLLHYCNSVYFSGREPVSSVPEAIGRVGFQTIFSLVSAVTGSKSFNPPANSGVDGTQLWKHSLTTAFACKFIADDIDADSNLLFTAGLLHDIGRVVLAQAKGAEYGQLLAQAAASGADTTALEKSAYGFTHADVGACLMETWKLPALLVQAVRFHHQPASGGSAKKHAAGVCVGNAQAHRFEHPADSPAVAANPELLGALELLGLGNRHLELYDEQMQENWDFVNRLIEMR
ncbi:MAG: HDOD domain-containing protein [Verrucomicrobiae bacterium]|nr:HDOD domain-containing protein [Verrucomicrobiae bacterium]